MSGLGEGRAHVQWQEALWPFRALELCLSPWSIPGNPWGAPEEGHYLPQANAMNYLDARSGISNIKKRPR